GLVERKRRIIALRPQHDDVARGPGELGKGFRERRAFAIVEAIGEPHDAVVRLAAELAPESFSERLAVRGVRLGTQSRGALARLLGGDRADQRIARRGRRQHHGPAVSHGAVYRGVDGLPALWPMGS